jgi:DNA-directed RNA polymerase specialized sigma24 family protein
MAVNPDPMAARSLDHRDPSLRESDIISCCARLSTADTANEPAATYERRRTLAPVRNALAQLSSQVSPKSFQVLYLRWIEGWATADVAAALALTPSQVRFRSCRMKQKVRHLLERSMARDGRGDEVAPRERDDSGRPAQQRAFHGE